jgi:hypothetical protein
MILGWFPVLEEGSGWLVRLADMQPKSPPQAGGRSEAGVAMSYAQR